MRSSIWLAGLAVMCVPATSHAFTVSSALFYGCHEEITETTVRNVRAVLSNAPTIAPDENERALITDLPFPVPADFQDISGASVLIGVRDNDLKGRSPIALDQLAAVHGDPNAQDEHCLRNEEDDEPNGSTAALARCGTFIHDKTMSAIDALDATGTPDPNVRDSLEVSLSIRGRVTVPLPAFWVRIGQAMHTLQDAFSHTYRTSDGAEITTVLNWVDMVDKTEVESRDGPKHLTPLDQCNAGDAIRSRNKGLALQASTDLLTAALDPSMTRDQKSAAVDAVIAKALAFSPGCTSDNGWCNAPETAYASSGCGCDVVGRSDAGLAGISLFALAVVAVRLRKRRIARASRLPVIASECFLAALLLPARAHAQDVAANEAKEEKHASVFLLAANVSGSIIDPALAQSLGVRFRVGKKLILGLDGELNEWFGVNGGRFEPGAASLYATAILRFPMRFESINLRTTFNLGASYELLSLYGVPSGSFGLFAGLYPLGLEFKLTGHVFVILNPLGLAVPIPHLTGAPYAVPQFRTQVGVEIAL